MSFGTVVGLTHRHMTTFAPAPREHAVRLTGKRHAVAAGRVSSRSAGADGPLAWLAAIPPSDAAAQPGGRAAGFWRPGRRSARPERRLRAGLHWWTVRSSVVLEHGVERRVSRTRSDAQWAGAQLRARRRLDPAGRRPGARRGRAPRAAAAMLDRGRRRRPAGRGAVHRRAALVQVLCADDRAERAAEGRASSPPTSA